VHPARRVVAPLIMVAATIAFGVTAYQWVEGWSFLDSLYMVVITLSTVGFAEVQPLSPSGEIITIGIIVLGIASVSLVIGQATRLIVEGEIRQVLGKRRMQKDIGKLSNHVIVCGYGRVGRITCLELARAGEPFVVIDNSEALQARIEEDGSLAIFGDATEESTLEAAGITRAKSLILALPSEADSVYVTLLAKQRFPDLFVLARGISDNCERRLGAAGADRVVSPNIIGGMRMAYSVLQPSVQEFIDILTARRDLELEIAKISITEDSPLAGTTLKESRFRRRFGVLVVAFQAADGSVTFNPSPDDVITAGDILFLLGRREQLEQFSTST
jgi:voltage-gated potassium channel